jgi:uncharacterized membrane protein YhaH (DUF805 family)
MTFIQAIQSGFRNYARFSSRATRSEFWFWVLFTVVGGVVGEVLDLLVFGYHSINFAPITELFWLGTLVPSFAVMIRRLHDTDRSGWWCLLGLVPLVGQIALIVLYCLKGTKGYNRFGADRTPAEPRPRHRVREATQ